jgi:hypothetical protein
MPIARIRAHWLSMAAVWLALECPTCIGLAAIAACWSSCLHSHQGTLLPNPLALAYVWSKGIPSMNSGGFFFCGGCFCRVHECRRHIVFLWFVLLLLLQSIASSEAMHLHN